MSTAEGPPTIHRLDEAVVNRIAAGEVIHRPSSALKELIENSVDAGATSIVVTVKDGGNKLLQVQDNGHGIRPEDMAILAERHTTSKLRDYEDLKSIDTLGFRGEALASMSFVAHLTVTTMTKDAAHAIKQSYKDGLPENPQPKPCAGIKGTTILVEDLFYNVATRRKALKGASEEYSRILDVVGRYAVFREGVSFTCKKHGSSSADIHTLATASRLDSIRAVYGPAVARELLPFEVSEEAPAPMAEEAGGDGEGGASGMGGLAFKAEGYVSSANYVAKRTVLVLFINGRMVECSPLKRSIEGVYSAVLPKASRPFVYLSITLPARHVDVNVHPTKKEVNFLHQEELIEAVRAKLESLLLEGNDTRTFYTQSTLPGVMLGSSPDGRGKKRAAEGEGEGEGGGGEGEERREKKEKTTQRDKAGGDHKLVRVDARNPAGRLDAFLRAPPGGSGGGGTAGAGADGGASGKRAAGGAGGEGELGGMRRAVRQRRNAKVTELTSVRELVAEVDRSGHAALTEVMRGHIFVGMVDEVLALVQHETKLYLVNAPVLVRDMMYQQVLHRFEGFGSIALEPPVPLKELVMIALETEERAGRLDESDGGKEEISSLAVDLLRGKAEMLREYFSLSIDDEGRLASLPAVVDHYTPDLDHLPELVLALANEVDWESEKGCFHTIAEALADAYTLKAAFPDPPAAEGGGGDTGAEGEEGKEEAGPDPPAEGGGGDTGAEGGGGKEGAGAEGAEGGKGEGKGGKAAEEGGGKGDEGRRWTVQHVLFPAMATCLQPPKARATDGTVLEIACLENLYKIFERC